jgi:hypothetical protein
LAQQPLGHELASQTHAPSLHAWPGEQAMHAAPLLPQAVAVSLAAGMQPLALQQPSQVEGSQRHAPFLHAWPGGQATHIEPLLPQAPALGVTQLPFLGSQQPWQLAGPHEHEWLF